MKKKWLSALAISFTLAFAFSGTACEFFGVNISAKENHGSSSTPDSSEPDETKTDEEIFTAVKEAALASCAYNGAYTMKLTGVQKLADREMKMGGVITANPQTKEMAQKGEEGQDGNVMKTYIENGRYYLYDKYEYLEDSSSSSEECYEINETQALASAKDGSFQENLGEHMAFTLADSFTYLQSAYNVVLAASVAEVKEEIPTVVSEHSVSVEYSEGVSSIIIVVRVAVEGWQEFIVTNRIDAKDGKIVRASASQKATIVDTEGMYGEQGAVITGEVEMLYEYAYTFDTELFNSITPCEITDTTSDSINIDFNVAGKFEMWGNTSIQGDKTGKELFETVYNDAFGEWNEESYSFDKWYLDEACTKEFNPSDCTVEELRMIEDLYTPSITVSQGYSLVVENSREENKLSLAYKIVEGTGMFFFGASNDRARYPQMHEAGGNVWFNIDDCDEFLVNGEKTTVNEWICEGGKIYYVERVEYYEDEDYNFFDFVG